jgi:hypothetical protein
MIPPIRISGNYYTIGESPFELEQAYLPGRWARLRNWVALWLRRMLPFLFALTLGAQDANLPQIPDKLQIRYFKAKAELSQTIQEMVVICRGDVGLNPDGTLVCVAPQPAKEETKK